MIKLLMRAIASNVLQRWLVVLLRVVRAQSRWLFLEDIAISEIMALSLVWSTTIGSLLDKLRRWWLNTHSIVGCLS